ncbi:MAG TPA: 3-dehydroquinate synthase [Ktedonobacteraceae bacterium]
MQRIILTGLSGAGKSTIGRLVATLLHWDFVDTDELLARRAGMATASQVLTTCGQQRFRLLESEALCEALSGERVVIATGGGIVTSAANRTLLHSQGLTIYLRTGVETAWQRIQEHLRTAGEAATRPLLATAPDGQARLSELLAARCAWYEQAHVSLATDAATPAQVAHQVFAHALAHGQLLPAASSARTSLNLRLAGGVSQAVLEWGSLCQFPAALKAMGTSARVFIVTDATVGALYGAATVGLLNDAGLSAHLYSVPAGEASKSFTCFQQIIDWLVEQRAERSEPLVALGGGVVGDLAGFVASCYQRGVPLVQLPTTLLAQIDSAIGGKTGINHALGKNLIGAFYQPGLTFVDPALLVTLPERVYREGWAEIVKYGVILDADLFALLETHLPEIQRRESAVLGQVIARCIRLKMDVVQADERDGGLRNILNYGHTFGHALEATTAYGTWLHGEAVSLGMEVAGRIAFARGLWSEEELLRQRRLLEALGLPVACPDGSAHALQEAMLHDKKVRAGRTRWVLPTCIGQVQLSADVAPQDVQAAIAAVCAPGSARP